MLCKDIKFNQFDAFECEESEERDTGELIKGIP